MTTTELLDCGHAPSPSTVSNGRGIDSQGRTYCYTCCAERDRESMRETGKACLYMTAPERGLMSMSPQTGSWHELTNWPGSLRIPVYYIRKGRHNMARVRYDFRFWFEGTEWAGTVYGDNTQIAHCRQLKGQSQIAGIRA